MFSLDQLEAGENRDHEADSRTGVQSPDCSSCSRACWSFVLLKLKLVPLCPRFDFQALWEDQLSFGCYAVFPWCVCLPRGSIAGAGHGMARHGTEESSRRPALPWWRDAALPPRAQQPTGCPAPAVGLPPGFPSLGLSALLTAPLSRQLLGQFRQTDLLSARQRVRCSGSGQPQGRLGSRRGWGRSRGGAAWQQGRQGAAPRVCPRRRQRRESPGRCTAVKRRQANSLAAFADKNKLCAQSREAALNTSVHALRFLMTTLTLKKGVSKPRVSFSRTLLF